MRQPTSSFIGAIIFLIIGILAAYEYIIKGAFTPLPSSGEAVFKPLTTMSLGLAPYLYRYNYKAEAQRVYETGETSSASHCGCCWARFLRASWPCSWFWLCSRVSSSKA